MTPEEFWSQNEAYMDKKFYVGFCILATSLNDYAVGRSLHRQNKLDWACTAYYYSLVHALRLVCFLVYGDFPMRHDNLAKVFKFNRKRLRISQFNKR